AASAVLLTPFLIAREIKAVITHRTRKAPTGGTGTARASSGHHSSFSLFRGAKHVLSLVATVPPVQAAPALWPGRGQAARPHAPQLRRPRGVRPARGAAGGGGGAFRGQGRPAGRRHG